MEEEKIDILTSQTFKDQLFISNTAWVFIILSSIGLYFSASNLVLSQFLIEAQDGFFESMGPEGEYLESIKTIQETISTGLLIGLVGAIALLISSVLLLKRKKIGRFLFTITCLSLSALAIVFVFYMRSHYIAGTAIFEEKSAEFANKAPMSLNKGLNWQLKSYWVFLCVVAWAFIRVLIKVNRKRIRQYFS